MGSEWCQNATEWVKLHFRRRSLKFEWEAWTEKRMDELIIDMDSIMANTCVRAATEYGLQIQSGGIPFRDVTQDTGMHLHFGVLLSMILADNTEAGIGEEPLEQWWNLLEGKKCRKESKKEAHFTPGSAILSAYTAVRWSPETGEMDSRGKREVEKNTSNRPSEDGLKGLAEGMSSGGLKMASEFLRCTGYTAEHADFDRFALSYMFAGWGDEAKPVCVLKSLQLAGLQMGSSTVGDAWLFLLLVLQAPPQILNEEIVVLWTRIHGEMSYYKDTVKTFAEVAGAMQLAGVKHIAARGADVHAREKGDGAVTAVGTCENGVGSITVMGIKLGEVSRAGQVSAGSQHTLVGCGLS
ncbi:hypothetical protein Q9966_002931 [Columba livia]|nr:hypothetical protein Q9966_002931 [Columba livia]